MPESYDKRGKSWVLGVTALASFMMALDALVITTAFATIRGDFGASVETLQWTVNAYNLAFAVFRRWRYVFVIGSIGKMDLDRNP